MRRERTQLDVDATALRVGLARHLITCGAAVGLAAFEPVGTLVGALAVLGVVYSSEVATAIGRIIKAWKRANA